MVRALAAAARDLRPPPDLRPLCSSPTRLVPPSSHPPPIPIPKAKSKTLYILIPFSYQSSAYPITYHLPLDRPPFFRDRRISSSSTDDLLLILFVILCSTTYEYNYSYLCFLFFFPCLIRYSFVLYLSMRTNP